MSHANCILTVHYWTVRHGHHSSLDIIPVQPVFHKDSDGNYISHLINGASVTQNSSVDSEEKSDRSLCATVSWSVRFCPLCEFCDDCYKRFRFFSLSFDCQSLVFVILTTTHPVSAPLIAFAVKQKHSIHQSLISYPSTCSSSFGNFHIICRFNVSLDLSDQPDLRWPHFVHLSYPLAIWETVTSKYQLVWVACDKMTRWSISAVLWL